MAEFQTQLIEGLDYYIENGKWVFTAEFLRRRGTCCWQGCRHCPFRGPEDDANQASF
jgi:hypothetical protein